MKLYHDMKLKISNIFNDINSFNDMKLKISNIFNEIKLEIS